MATTVSNVPAPVSASTVREKMAAARSRIARVKRVDRAAVAIITFGGIAVIVAVVGILVFIGVEAVPLFRAAEVRPDGTVTLATAMTPANAPVLRAIGIDEYRRYVYTLEPDGRVVLHRYDTGKEASSAPVPGVEGTAVTSSSRSLLGGYVAAGLANGTASLLQVRALPKYEDGNLVDVSVEIRERGLVRLDPAGRAVRQLAYSEFDGQRFVAGVVGDQEVAAWWTDAEGGEHTGRLVVPGTDTLTQVRVGRAGSVVAGTASGALYHWLLRDPIELTDVGRAADAVTALEFLIGGTSFVTGTADGHVDGWFRAPIGDGGAYGLVRTHEFERQGAAVRAIAPSSRDRSFATVGDDGAVWLRHQTSERTLARVPGSGPLSAVLITPKNDGVLTLHDGQIDRFQLVNPHPEVSWRTLFGKVWYEGYAHPEYVWQSTGATDDFEPKLSLVPLIFGTLKGTFYALLFAIPIAVLGALYTSQFVHPAIRAKVKPTVEIMAALPSVVIGFLGGLFLAPAVERHLASVVATFVTLPLFGTLGVVLWRGLPRTIARRIRPGTEVLLLLPLLALGGWVAFQVGPPIERLVFGGDLRAWIYETLGVTYDQRNSLVVGLAMGFAVIPIIFTVSEDAFSTVPANLAAASLALGASRWQTATRVVLPTASPGVFSAIMIGFGRAVGETMIVLMATGNTPILDWSIFNGMRTLSANIAVEIPEAPFGGTLYRVLFLSAALLFVLTFVVNTIAELVRQRLRDRYKAV
jgi:phosphate transport system permease protein